MTEVVAIGFGVLLIAVVIGVGWWQVYDHGFDNAKLKEETKRADEAEDIQKALLEHPLSADEQLHVLRRLRNRGGAKRWVSKARAKRRS